MEWHDRNNIKQIAARSSATRALRAFAPGLKQIEDATASRHRVLGAFEKAEMKTDSDERRRLLSFAIIGAGLSRSARSFSNSQIMYNRVANQLG
jgi:hypothetical protein